MKVLFNIFSFNDDVSKLYWITDGIITKRVNSDELMDNCIDAFYQFYDVLMDDKKDSKVVDNLQNDLLYKLEWFQLKTQLGKQCELTLNNDIKLYRQQLIDLQTKRENIINQIQKLNQKLNEAKSQRDNQEEYNIMIQQINKEPPRQTTIKALNEMKAKLNEINNALNQCNKTIQRRSKQCYAAFAAVQALNRSITQTTGDNKIKSDKQEEEDDDNDVDMMQ